MFSKEEYWKNRKAGKRGQGEQLKPVYVEGSGKAVLHKIGNEERAVSRREKRAFLRAVRSDILKGRIDINQLMKERLERDRKESGQGV